MKRRTLPYTRLASLLCGLLVFLEAPGMLGEPSPAAVAAFSAYDRSVETRLAQQHRSASSFLAPHTDERLRRGELIIEKLMPDAEANPPGGLLHHWRGTAFARGATAADFEQLMLDFKSYPQHFAPQVLQAGVIAQRGDSLQGQMRIRQHHVITVVMDTAYDVRFGHLDVRHGYSISRSTRIAEIEGAGTSSERALGPNEEHGFLWRLNTYWSYEERDGGLYMQIETVSLTRAVPRGLGWAVRPYVESIPRESLEFTLRSACNAVRK